MDTLEQFNKIMALDNGEEEWQRIIKVENDLEVEIDSYLKLDEEWKKIGERRKEQRAIAEQAIHDAVSALDKDFATGLYQTWAMLGFATAFQKAMYRVHGIRRIPVDVGFDCANCDEPIVVYKASEWNSLNWPRSLDESHNMICPKCQAGPVARMEAERVAEFHRKRREQIAAYRAMPYQEYLQTDHWKEVRAAALKKAKYQCFLCGSGEELNVHHRTYARLGDEYQQDLAVLCRHCHKHVHRKGDGNDR